MERPGAHAPCPLCGRRVADLANHYRYCERALVAKASASRAPLADATNAPPPPARAQLNVNSLKRKADDCLLDMQLDHQMTHKNVCAVRHILNSVVEDIIDASNHGPSGDDEEVEEDVKEVEQLLQLYDDPDNWRKERQANRQNYPYIAPDTRELRDEGKPVRTYAYFSIIKLIHRRLVHDKGFRQRHVALSKELRKGEKHKKYPTGPIKTMLDGIKARYHHRLHAKSDDVTELRLAGIAQVDDLEVRGALASNRNPISSLGHS
jgi:hypothetical protein